MEEKHSTFLKKAVERMTGAIRTLVQVEEKNVELREKLDVLIIVLPRESSRPHLPIPSIQV